MSTIIFHFLVENQKFFGEESPIIHIMRDFTIIVIAVSIYGILLALTEAE